MFLFLLTATTGLFRPSQALTSQQQQEILYWHNAARSTLSQGYQCSNMPSIAWNNAIHNAAVSNHCPTTLSNDADTVYGSALGENLAFANEVCRTGLCEEAGICDPNAAPESASFCETDCSKICTFKSLIFIQWFEDHTVAGCDWQCYLDRYEDLQQESGSDLAAAATHYATIGLAEGRDCTCEDADPAVVTCDAASAECTQLAWPGATQIGCHMQINCPTSLTTLNCNYESMTGGTTAASLVNIQINFLDYLTTVEELRAAVAIETQSLDFIDHYISNVNIEDGLFGFGYAQNFGARITADVSVSRAGDYTFELESDDGSFLYVNDLEISNGGSHGMITKTGVATLSAGTHQVEVLYFQGTGGAGLRVSLYGVEDACVVGAAAAACPAGTSSSGGLCVHNVGHSLSAVVSLGASLLFALFLAH